jgi:hypothetical protein
MTNMCTCVILLLLRLAVNMSMNNILITAKKRLNLTNLRIEMYPAEGPMLKAPVAPDPLMVSCSKSRTTVGATRCTQCRSRSEKEGAPAGRRWRRSDEEEDGEQSRRHSSKTWSPAHTQAVSRCERRFQRPALPHSGRAEDGMRSARMQLDRRTMWCIVLGNRETGGKVMLERWGRRINWSDYK